MNSQDILRALKAGEISPEEAKKALQQLKAAQATQKIPTPNPTPSDIVPPAQGAIAADTTPIAIVGISGRYPGAAHLDQYWDNLLHGRNTVREIPAFRWDADAFYAPYPYQEGKIYCKWMGMLDDIAEFDPLFFNISPAEAEAMDPQHRIFLQEAYRAFEDAGYCRQSLSNKNCGVYMGIMSNEYGVILSHYNNSSSATTGNSYAIAPARISYFLNLKGPAIPIDTACSSSLVGAHLACQALRHGEIDMALVGGVTLYLTPGSYMSMCSAGMLSPDGQCKAFDNGANGFVPGEGAGALILKRLQDAEADHDHIYGVIIGSGINQDGKTNGITAPNLGSQIALEKEIYRRYRIDPATISYAEMHGTGTKLGDPIELEALSTAFKSSTDKRNYCAIGAVKSNLGHTSAAAGAASIHKVLLCMQHQQLVPTLHFKHHNEHFNFSDSPFFVNTDTKQWQTTTGQPRRACVSSFGFSGTNAHLVIEEYRANTAGVEDHHPALFVLSAHTQEQLHEYAAKMSEHITAHPALRLADICYTAQTGRDEMSWRLAIVADSLAALHTTLQHFLEENSSPALFTGHVKKGKGSSSATAAQLESWYMQQALSALAAEWVNGARINWLRLYNTTVPYRVSLPTYPFLRESWWCAPPAASIPAATPVPVAAALPVATPPQQTTPDTRSRSWVSKQWITAEWPRSTESPFLQTVAILVKEEDDLLAQQIAGRFSTPIILHPDQLSSFDWITAPRFDGCIDLLGCSRSSTDWSLWVPWLQQLIEQDRQHKLTLLALSRGLEAFLNQDMLLSGAGQAALYRMLQSEYSHLCSRHIDIAAATTEEELQKIIATEWESTGNEPEITYRNGQRYRSVLQQLPLPGTNGRKPVFLPGQVLLITGGTKGIGMQCALHFARHYHVKFIALLGREHWPHKSEWAAIKHSDSPLAQKIRDVEELESMGVSVRVYQPDLTNREAVTQCIEKITNTLGPIAGVIHSAGIVDKDNPAFIRKTIPGMEAVWSPKTIALELLYEQLKTSPLQFFLLFSSVSAIIPSLSIGQSDYAMANAWMDYRAQTLAPHFPIISIQWPSWKETGMGETRGSVYQRTGLWSHTNEEGLQWLDHILAHRPAAVILPAIVHPGRWKPEQLLQKALEPSPAVQAPVTPVPQEKKLAPAADLFTGVRGWLLTLFAQELKIAADRLETDTAFQDYGVDSIILTQIVRHINQLIPAPMDPSILYEYATIDALADWLSKEYESPLRELQAMTTPAIASTPSKAPAAAAKQTTAAPSTATATTTDIAVVGMSARFPGAPDLKQYWTLLREGQVAIGAVPPARTGKTAGYYAGTITTLSHFDPAYFLLPEEDARAMDPQALLILEESLKTFHHAGYTAAEVKGQPIGVYIGGRSRHTPDPEDWRKARNPVVTVGQNYLATNVSQFFDLRGPALVVDTACSSALTGMQIAIQSLLTGHIRSALVGGVSVLQDGSQLLFQQRGLLGDTPAFHVFDQRARGIIPGEGAGMVLLKTLSQAQADGDQIYAVIKGLAINNDGRTAGPATPNPQAQKEVMIQALAASGLTPTDIGYIEANGSGSEVTDLLELKAIQTVYSTPGRTALGLGSIKPNIGHPLCAEGIASFIKVALMLAHQETVPFLSGEQPLRHFDMAAASLEFPRQAGAWPYEATAAAINCFADGGTNAHVILTAAAEQPDHIITRKPLPIPALNRQDLHPAKPAVATKQPASGDAVGVYLQHPSGSDHNIWKLMQATS
ncbi:KR domain-containing protein [Chitinophaga pendula]|uniref:type I polyketide synthase n=1 Tax=Chitinophaga TaxID=79328 RepID=UPI0018DFAD68|nr:MULTISPECIES: type I polyketide synthase [Chitinophaga]UCJ09482.1 KR domain-containing protein [Chitinophaga pendula]